MKPMTGTKALPSQPTTAYRFSKEKLRQGPIVSSLFAEGVDVGVELALRWMEAELARYGTSSDSVQNVLRQLRTLSRRVQRGSFRRQVLRGEAVSTEWVRSEVAGKEQY